MPKVMTACGPIDASQVGKTLIHEHLVMGFPGWEFDPEYVFDKNEVMEILIKDVMAMKKYGVNTIVDAYPYDPCRYPELYRELQKKTGVNIINSTGAFNASSGVVQYWGFLLALGYSADVVRPRLVKAMLRDIQVGIDGTDVKAGIIKVATDVGEEMTPYEKLTFSAAGIVQKETGVPVITHMGGATKALEQADTLITYGAAPEKVAIGHMCDTDDFDYIESVLKKGVYVNFDRLGIDYTLISGAGEAGKVKTIAELIKRGWGQRIMLGHDFCSVVPGLIGVGKYMHEEQAFAWSDFSHWGPCGIFEYHIPQLLKLGVTEEQIEELMVNNPRRFFS